MDTIKLLDLAKDLSVDRSKIVNSCNGKAYMSCVIINKSRSCVLCDWHKLLQY